MIMNNMIASAIVNKQCLLELRQRRVRLWARLWAQASSKQHVTKKQSTEASTRKCIRFMRRCRTDVDSGGSLQINTALFWPITFILWWNISIPMGVVSSRVAPPTPTVHPGSLNRSDEDENGKRYGLHSPQTSVRGWEVGFFLAPPFYLSVVFSRVFSNVDYCTVAGCWFMLWNDLALSTRPEGESCRKPAEQARSDFGIVQEMGLKLWKLFRCSRVALEVECLLSSIARASASVSNSACSRQPSRAVSQRRISVLMHFLWSVKSGALVPSSIGALLRITFLHAVFFFFFLRRRLSAQASKTRRCSEMSRGFLPGAKQLKCVVF